jgi:cellulose synthase/poly-beta-1,6-N-acetylglucosamine synthase-like glycosyltransferase
VPLNREADVVPDLIAALRAIDYPPHRLEVLLIVETDDQATRAAILGAAPPTHMRLVCVPPGAPRTKPRALNFALQEAAGDYVVIYDAEDCPEPRQLRDALALLKADTSGRLGCVQARLEIYNRGQSWLTRQFTIEYAALFYALLPALTSLGLPVPLSGTSNHFPRRVLADVGGWDPHNVTEDADLGIRLARMGYRVDVLDSATSEEAPRAYRSWLRQRTRWLKGWMQTYLVHMRQPARLWRELGPRRFAGFQILMGGLILSALVHPILLVSLGASLWQGRDLISDGSRLDAALSWLGLFNLAAGYVTGMAVGAAAVIAARLPTLAWGAVTMPIYWIVISLAAYRALLQLVTAPYLWEKTDHTARSSQAHAQVRPGGEDGANATARDPSLQSP